MEQQSSSNANKTTSSTADSKTEARSKSSSEELDDLNDDGRVIGDWESRWSSQAKKFIKNEVIYVSVVFLATLVALVFTWRGDIYGLFSAGCQSCREGKFLLFSYLFLGGMLGGVLFGIKYLYKVVARGWWNEDRWLWRMFSPFLSGGLALAVGALLDSGLLGVAPNFSSETYFFSVGFITGYFADRALGKMQEIATTIFGNPGQS